MYNKVIFSCIIFIIYSCNKIEKKSISEFDLKKSDTIYQRVSKIPVEELTKIEIPEFIDLDTITENKKLINLVIKNKGKKNLVSLTIKPPCSCIQMPNYKKTLLPNESQKISIMIPFDEFGNFYKSITVYGNFYPYIKKIYIEGYRKKTVENL